jgi:molecular chaperone DnaK (HSP70)
MSSAGPKYSIGIDLGTTNSALAFAALGVEQPAVEVAAIPQLTGPNEVSSESLLPSFLYLNGEKEFPEGGTSLPWNPAPAYVVGRFAQRRGAEVAGRLVSSAKSWLSYPAVDRTSALLPQQAPEGVGRISPVSASAAYLEHLRAAWNEQHPDAPFNEQDVLVTVPASFDAIARELTQRAAKSAGYPDAVLLEEPQAAFYAWVERHPDWRTRLGKGDLVLVIDIGGGTTDFTLISVADRDGQLELERVAVGDHILLGGDNIDLALAHAVNAELAGRGTKLDAFQMQTLRNQCRVAKEKLLDPESTDAEAPVTILGKGSSLIGGTIRAKLTRDQLAAVLEGFLPRTSSTEMPEAARRAGLQEIGLPYAHDAAITRHLAKFLRQRAAESEHGAVRRGASGLACPTHVLFNGGVLYASLVRERVAEVLNGWLAEEGFAGAELLPGEDLDHAVARGAAYYGAARRGKGVRIRGGIARSYYVGIESAMPAVPGVPAPLKALAVAQFGMEEGTSVTIPGREFGLAVGEPAEFRFFSSSVRKDDPPGELIEDLTGDLDELAPMQVTLSGSSDGFVPVSFETAITETGVLQLWCKSRDGERWKLEFDVREKR